MFRVFKWETIKVEHKQKILLYFLIYIILHVVLIHSGFQAAGKFQTTEIKKYYAMYMEKSQGRITEQKLDNIQRESADIEKLTNEVNQAKDAYIDKKIDYNAYETLMKEGESIDSKTKALLLVQAQADLQKGKEKQYQYLYNTKPDQSLLLQNYDYLFVFLLIMLSIATFFTDKDTEMDAIIHTTKLGNQQTRKFKRWILFLTILFFGLLSEVITSLMIYKDIGAFHFMYPIQSIPEYATCKIHINILELYLLQTGIKVFGYFLVSLFFSSLANKVSKLTSLYGLAIFTTILPPLLFKNSKLIYFNPLWGLLSPQYYIRDTIMNDELPIFLKFTSFEILVVAGLSILLGFGFIKILKQRRKTLKHWGKKGLLMFLALVLMGCTSQHVTQTADTGEIYNFRQLMMDEIDKDTIYMKDDLKRTYVTYTIPNQNISSFNHDIAYSFLDSEIPCIIPSHDAVYYMRVKDFYNFYIVKRDKKSNHETILYSNTEYKNNSNSIVPFFTTTHKVPDNVESPQSFFIKGKDLFIVYNTTVEQINISSHKKKKILDNISLISIYNQDIYYTNTEGNLNQYNINTKKTKLVCKELVDQFEITANGIYFSNLNDNDTLYFYSFSKKTIEKVIDKRLNMFSVYGNTLAYIDKDDIVLYDVASKKSIKTLHQNCLFLKLLNEKYLLYKQDDRFVLYDYVKDNSVNIKISE